MWARQSHLLHTLTALTSPKVKLKWNGVKQKAFDDIKHTVTHDTLNHIRISINALIYIRMPEIVS